MTGSDFSATQRTTKTDSQAFSPDVVNKYWGISIYFILALFQCSVYLFTVVNTALSGESVHLRLCLATHMYLITILASWAYLLTTTTPPPKIPSRFRFTDAERRALKVKNFDFSALQDELKVMAERRGVRTRTPDGLVNACKHCLLLKPERTHHCRVCKTCVAKMDHHCPWFGNCIHYYNFKFFLQAIFYSVLGMVFMTLTALVVLLVTDDGLERMKAVDGAITSFGIFCFISLGVGLTAGGFFAVQIRQAFRNMSTLESLKGMVYFAGGVEDSYDLGSTRLNLAQQLGPVKLAWLVPVKSTPGDGTEFLLRSDVKKDQRRTLTLEESIEQTDTAAYRARLESSAFSETGSSSSLR